MRSGCWKGGANVAVRGELRRVDGDGVGSREDPGGGHDHPLSWGWVQDLDGPLIKNFKQVFVTI